MSLSGLVTSDVYILRELNLGSLTLYLSALQGKTNVVTCELSKRKSYIFLRKLGNLFLRIDKKRNSK